MNSGIARPLAGLATVVAIAAIVAVAVGLFRDSFTKTVPVTVISDRAGLVMNPDAKVKLHGAQVGKVASIELAARRQGRPAPGDGPRTRCNDIPANVGADITSSTVFGSKFVELESARRTRRRSRCSAGQVIEGKHVTVEINTVFQQLVSVLSKIDPTKLNQTLGAIAKALQRPRRQVRSDPGRLRRRAGQDQPEPGHAQPRNRHRASGVRRLRRRRPRPAATTVTNATKISDTIVDQDNRTWTPCWSAPSGWPTSATEVLGEQPAAADQRTASAGPHHRSAQQVQRGAQLRHRRAGSVGHRAAAAAARSCHCCSRSSWAVSATGTREPAQGRRHGRPAVHRPAEGAVRDQPAVRGRRHRCQPGAVRQPGHPAQLRRSQAGVVRPDRRPAAQHRTDRAAGMTRAVEDDRQVRRLRRRDGVADRRRCSRSSASTGRGQTTRTRRCSPMRRSLKSGDTVRVAGVRVGTVNERRPAAGQQGDGRASTPTATSC